MLRRRQGQVVSHLAQFTGGGLLAAVFYYAAEHFATADCLAIQSSIHSQGPAGLGLVVIALTIASALAVPVPLVSIGAGVVVGSYAGSAVACLGVVMASGLWFVFGRFLSRFRGFTGIVRRQLAKYEWHRRMVEERTHSGFEWVIRQSLTAPMPPPLLAGLSGVTISHLSFQSAISGLFIGALGPATVFSIAGDHIGCALIDSAQGHKAGHHVIGILKSVALIILLPLLPSVLLRRNADHGSQFSKMGGVK